MSERMIQTAVAIKHSIAHSPAAGWFAVLITYVQTVWLEWGSVIAEIISWTIGTSLSLILLANHSITLYKSIKNMKKPDTDEDKQG